MSHTYCVCTHSPELQVATLRMIWMQSMAACLVERTGSVQRGTILPSSSPWMASSREGWGKGEEGQEREKMYVQEESRVQKEMKWMFGWTNLIHICMCLVGFHNVQETQDGPVSLQIISRLHPGGQMLQMQVQRRWVLEGYIHNLTCNRSCLVGKWAHGWIFLTGQYYKCASAHHVYMCNLYTIFTNIKSICRKYKLRINAMEVVSDDKKNNKV